MDSDDFTSGSGSSTDTASSGDEGAAGPSTPALDLARIVRRVEPPITHRTQARRDMRKLVDAKELEYYDVIDTDLVSDAYDLDEYNMKLLTDVDVTRLFVGTSTLRKLLEVEQARGAYLIMHSSEQHRSSRINTARADGVETKVGVVQVAPCLTEVLLAMRMEFAVNIRFPDETMRQLPLRWELDSDDYLILTIATPPSGTAEILAVSSDEDDLIFFDIHFMRDGVCLPNFIVMRACTTIGRFARAVSMDKGALTRVLQRLYEPVMRNVREHVTLESYARRPEDGPRAIPQMVEVPLDGNPSTLVGSAAHYPDTPGAYYAFASMRDRSATDQWDRVTDTYRTTAGWHHLIPGKQLNRNFKYAAGELACDIFVNIDDSVHDAQRTLYAEVYHMLQTRHAKHARIAAKQIVQMSRPADDPAHDALELEYMTNDEGFVERIRAASKGKAPAIDRTQTLMSCYYALHRFRTFFDADAYPHITISPFAMSALNDDEYTSMLARDRLEMTRYISDYIIDKLLVLEKNNSLERKVHLRGWEIRCPLEFAGAALTKMIDSDVYQQIWTKYLIEKREMRRIAAQQSDTHTVVTRVAGIAGWLISPFTACRSSVAKQE